MALTPCGTVSMLANGVCSRECVLRTSFVSFRWSGPRAAELVRVVDGWTLTGGANCRSKHGDSLRVDYVAWIADLQYEAS